MSKWKGPFEELYYQALSDGAQDIAKEAENILRDAGLAEEQIVGISDSFKQHADNVHQRHAYTRSMLSAAPTPPADRMRESSAGSYDFMIPG